MRNPYWYFTPYYPPRQPSVPVVGRNPEYPTKSPTKNYPNCIIEERYCDYFDVGDPAPDFTLEGIINDQPEEVTLSDYLGHWVVLFFYGSNFTFV